jgi:hypothetical protein
MHLYLITNLLNNKQYVGITTQKNPHRRWIEHKSKALKDKNKNPIHSAIKKYGCENFKFEIVKELNSSCINELLEEETKLILKLNTLAPNGYNLKLKSSFRIVSPELSRKLSRGNQGVSKSKNPSSRFIGVYKKQKSSSFSCEIAFQKKKYKKVFLLEEDAAKTYDMMAIYLYGRESKTNFPQSLYSDEQVNKCFSSFYERSGDFYSSKYPGIYFSNERNAFRIRYNKKHIGQAPTEEEAKEILDEYIKNINDPNFDKNKKQKHKRSTLKKIEKTKILLERNLSYQEIAQELGITKHNVQYIIKLIHGSHPICEQN